ncbi:MAG: hypothetical protein ABSF99_07795 [Anaerolineales bacterium]|jgi:hypothetical protein
MDSFIYIPGDEPEKSAPLSRYLPPIPEGVAATFLAGHFGSDGLEQPAWILDPFGASPQLATEIARNGYRTLVAVNNPVTRFLLEMAANPPSQADLRAALAELAAARKGSERLETHLQSLYLTKCNRCQQEVAAEAFVWERLSGALTARIYHCPCGDEGEHPATEADQRRATSLALTDGLHRARALERVAAPNDPDRLHAEEALECYLPRAVYALITIINKLDSLPLSAERRRALLALVLTACDEASTLWPHPDERPRPKQLTLPSRFLEKNVWLALERGVELWSGSGKPIQVTIWPEIAGESGGLCLFEGPMRDLAPRLKGISIAAVLTAIPRPNQAFWTLSALWAGWLWGQEAVAPFKSVLRRRRYDWNWHAAALYATLKNISGQMPLNAPLFAIISEIEPAFLSAALLAAAEAGFDLSGLALRSPHDPVQGLWHRRTFTHEDKELVKIDAEGVQQAMRLALQERGEPAPYLNLLAAGLIAMASEHSLRWRQEALTQIHTPIQVALTEPEFVHHAESQNPESGLWALAEWDNEVEPLSDRVEIAAVHFLQKNPTCTFRDLEIALNSELPGLLTPSLDQLRAVLASYALETDGVWALRPEDSPAARRLDLETAAQALAALGVRLGYTLQREEVSQRLVRWLENGQTVYTFTLLASAVVGRLLRQNQPPPLNSFLILPGGRASLLAYKLDRDPVLKSMAEGWHVIKFRHLRQLAGLASLTQEQFEKEISSDPIEPPEQMKLF